ncbi:MAG: thioredoxin family protein [Crocinitomicaceae bacterium]|nr:thioredoxin family protein [Crocinitomicaceae bacterium]|tara:strand:- start:366 stop:833 length:468 start_codon:yes stop_codon:yes gene_type:complete
MKQFLVFIIIALAQTNNAQTVDLNWHTDLSKAVSISINEKKPIMLFFTGSDWCGWCMRLKKEVFNHEKFKIWSDDQIILVELDFPRRKKLEPNILNQNRELARIFGVSGYPTCWLVKPQILENSKVNFLKLGKLGYVAGGTDKWISVAEKFLIKN